MKPLPLSPFTTFLILMSFLMLQACRPAPRHQPLFPEEPVVRVLILKSAPRIVLHSGDGFLVRIPGLDLRPGNSITLFPADSGLIRLIGPDGSEWLAAELWIEPNGDSFVIEDVPYGQGWWWGGREDRSYEGILHVYATQTGGVNAGHNGGMDASPNSDKDAGSNGSMSNVRLSALSTDPIGATNTTPVRGLDAVLHLPMETYLMGVIPYEIGPESPLEALKSQAVAARSEIVQTMITGKYRGRYHDVCADVECQVFAGNNRRSARSDSAVTLTRAQVLMYENEVIDAYYASNCGGMSDLPEKVWPWRGGPRPYLTAAFDGPGTPSSDPQKDIDPQTGIDPQTDFNPQKDIDRWLDHPPDSWCNPHIHIGLPGWSRANFRWSREVPFSDFTITFDMSVPEAGNPDETGSPHTTDGTDSQRTLDSKDSNRITHGKDSRQTTTGDVQPHLIHGIDSLQVIERGASGRIHRMLAWYRGEAVELNYELAIRQMVHPPLRSSAFRWTRTDTSFVFEGAGWGHGVGMCQSGAVSRAMSGHDYTRILKHYYPHTRMTTVFE